MENKILQELIDKWFSENKNSPDIWDSGIGETIKIHLKRIGRWKCLPRGNPKAGLNKMLGRVVLPAKIDVKQVKESKPIINDIEL